MDPRMDIVRNYEKMKIGIDDSFQFHCRMCGKCCHNRIDILLNPFDLYRMAKELSISVEKLFTLNCKYYVGSTSGMIIVRLDFNGPKNACPMLRNKKCVVHKAKPTVCALYPLGRTLENYPGDQDGREKKIQYILQEIDCGDKSETHTVREWVSGFDLDAEDVFFSEWTRAVMEIGPILNKAKSRLPVPMFDILCSLVLRYVYLDYKTDEPFLTQFENNVRECRDALRRIGIDNAQTEN